MVMTAAESAITITVFFFTNCSIADRMHTLFILFALLLFLSFIFSPFAFFFLLSNGIHFAKQKEASKRNGVVGNTGRITPIAPSAIEINAAASQRILIGFFIIFFINNYNTFHL